MDQSVDLAANLINLAPPTEPTAPSGTDMTPSNLIKLLAHRCESLLNVFHGPRHKVTQNLYMLIATMHRFSFLILLATCVLATAELTQKGIVREFQRTLKKFSTGNLQNKASLRSSFKNFRKFALLVDYINHDVTIPFMTELNKFSIEPLSDMDIHFGLNASNLVMGEEGISSAIEEMEASDSPVERYLQTQDQPESVDWRDTLSTPQDQGKCGSCWSFSSVTSVEAAYYRATGIRKEFSYQELVDCLFEGRRYGNGCLGADITSGLMWVLRNKHLASRISYPYVARDGDCKRDTKPNSWTNVAVRRLYRVPKSDEALLSAVVGGVVSVGVKGGRSLFAYKTGIYEDRYLCRATSIPNHAVNLVGYGEEGGRKFWRIRNSWGSEWGEGGYYRMTRDKVNHCKINRTALRLDLRCLKRDQCWKDELDHQESDQAHE